MFRFSYKHSGFIYVSAAYKANIRGAHEVHILLLEKISGVYDV